MEEMDLELYQIDLMTTFLNRELDEEIYTYQPTSFVPKCQECKVFKLNNLYIT